MKYLAPLAAAAAATVLASTPLSAHDGPDPLMHWSLKPRFIGDGGKLTAQRGPDIDLGERGTAFVESEFGIVLGGAQTPTTPVRPADLPAKDFTLTAWCSIDRPREYGGLISALEDNGGFEKGFILGYDQQRFYVGLASEGADDGDGAMTYLLSKQAYERGKFYHLAATYDGETLALFVNGQLSAESKAQSGPVLYPDRILLGLGGYRDTNENHPHHGHLLSANIYNAAAKPDWVAGEFAHGADLVKEKAPSSREVRSGDLDFAVRPYLQFGTRESMTVMWEANAETAGVVHWGETDQCVNRVEGEGAATIHEITISGLQPGTQYFYRCESRADRYVLDSEVRTFQTDAGGDTPFAFAVISDTQGNPEVSGKFAGMAWAQRPNFLLHPGDLVSTGRDKSHWVDHFFASMEPLISRVPFYPVLGNHEQNADHYYSYVAVPEPEYYYTFRYGNAQFFMIDTNKKVGPGSEQYKWLAAELGRSTATWKFACHHHPPYSSDENDYGKLWNTNVGTRGDTNARELTALYDKHGVDVVWNGHIHSYERTWPVKAGEATDGPAPIYMITGGGGGGLETPGPFRPPFSHLVARGHHYAMVWINGRQFSYKAYDLDGKLFDTFTLEKAAARPRP